MTCQLLLSRGSNNNSSSSNFNLIAATSYHEPARSGLSKRLLDGRGASSSHSFWNSTVIPWEHGVSEVSAERGFLLFRLSPELRKSRVELPGEQDIDRRVLLQIRPDGSNQTAQGLSDAMSDAGVQGCMRYCWIKM